MASRRELEDLLIQADAANDTESVSVLLDELDRLERGSAMDPIMQGLTFGWADELGQLGAYLGRRAAGATPERASTAGEREKARQREDLAAFRERDPVGSFILEMAPAFVPGLGLSRLAQPVTRGMSTMPAMMTVGATEGAIAGAGVQDEGMGTGALTGAVMGAVLPPALTTLTRGARAVPGAAGSAIQRLTGQEVSTTPGRVMEDIMQTEQLTPTTLRARQRQLGPEAMPADLMGPMGTQTAQGILQKDRTGRAIADAKRAAGTRAAGSTRRLQDDLRTATRIERGMLQSLDEINARQRAASGEAYDIAMGVPIDPSDQQLVEILNRPSVKRSLRQAVSNARDEGIPTPELDAILARGEDWTPEALGDLFPNMRALDQMKKSMDRMVNSAYRTGDPGADSMRQARNAFRDRLDDLNPAYKKAREIWAGDEALKDAMLEGEKMFNRNTREVEEFVRNLTDSEREAYLRGAMEATQERMGRARAGEIGEFRFLEQGNTREKLNSVFVRPGMDRKRRREGQRAAAKLLRTLKRERDFAENRNVLVRGAETAHRLAAGESLGGRVSVPTTVEMVMSPKTGIPRAALGGAVDWMAGLNQPTINRLSQLMFTPGGADQVIAELSQRGLNQQQIQQLTQQLAQIGAAAAPGTSMGIMNLMEGDYAP